MGERRKRKSMWDMEEESRHVSRMNDHSSWTGKDRHTSHGSGRYHEFSDPRTTSTRQSRDHSDWPPWESFEENPSAQISSVFKNAPDDTDKRYYQKMSPGFDGMEPRSYNHRLRDRSHSQRGRTRGRSRSRSLSRARERERERGRGWSRSRSRSRSRSDLTAKDHIRSRSPMSDYRHQSQGWSDRRSGSEKPSQICRDFAAGGCRRGSQCRFFHPNSTNRRDGVHMEDDRETWRSREEDHGRIPKHSYGRNSGFESSHGVSDSYNGEEERYLNKSGNPVTCKDFVRGKCRWGDSCRFSHHVSSDDGFGRGSRNESFDNDDFDPPSYRNEKPPCKFFAAGKCGRDNCRFAHMDPNRNKTVDGRRGEISENRTSHEKIDSWSGPTWDDVSVMPDAPKPGGWEPWDATVVTDKTTGGNSGNGQNDDRESKNRGILEYTNSAPNLNKTLEGRQGEISENRTSHEKNDTWSGPTWDDARVMSDAPKPGGWEPWDARVMSDPRGGDAGNGQNDDRESKNRGILEYTNSVQMENGSYGGHMAPAKSISEHNMSNKQEPHLMLQNPDGTVNVHIQNALLEYQKLSLKSLQQNVYPAPRVTENNEMSSLRVSDLVEVKDTIHTIQITHPTLLSGENLNEAERVKNIPDLNMSSGFSTDLNGSLNVRMQTTNNQTALQLPFLEPRAPQFPANLMQPLVNTNQDAVSLDPLTSNGNGRDKTQHENHPSSTAVTEFDVSIVEHRESPRPKQEEVIVNSETTEPNKVEESKGVENNNKVEDGNGAKDEKGMRLFKNALVEFVKEILKPIWKEGKMSREVHKTVVKKVVEKVSSTIQADRIPKTQDKVEQYLSSSKPKITKLIQAYVERCPKSDS